MLPVSTFIQFLWHCVLDQYQGDFLFRGYTFTVVSPFVQVQVDKTLYQIESYEELISFFRVFL